MKNIYILFGFLILSGGGLIMYKMTRGIRNNNPGNIKKTATAWQGEIKGFDKTFETFDTMENGVRAIGKVILTYFDRHNLSTVKSIISRYSATDQKAYIDNVSKSLDVEPDWPINVRNHLKNIVRAIIRQENGLAAAFVSEADLSNGIEQALS